jgi:trehalose 6-phosphate phosphatase
MLPGKAVFEVKRPNVNKGEGVRELMTHPPFAGRMPIFIGDDVTDEAVFAVLPELGGKGFSVGRHFAGLAGIFSSPKQVRDALQRLAGLGQAQPS